MVLVTRQSTEAVAPEQAFDYWRSTALARVAVDAVGETGRFRAARLLAVSRHATLIHTRSSPLSIARQPQHVRRDGLDDVCLSLVIRGSGHHEQGRRGGLVGPGGIGLVSLDRPFASGVREPYEELRLHVPRAAYEARVGRVETVAGRTFAGGTALADLFADYLRALVRSIERLSEDEAAHAVAGALHLLRGLVEGGPAGPEPELPAAGLRSLVQAHIQRRLHDPDLDPAAICAALRISRTRLYAAQSGGEGVAAAIRDARLDRARACLTAPAWDGEPIAAILHACGFRDAAGFGRAFRRRFGMTPRDARRQVRG
ncbi:helix-turn-helix domain-containing protein [Methylobacterium sp. JK268]